MVSEELRDWGFVLHNNNVQYINRPGPCVYRCFQQSKQSKLKFLLMCIWYFCKCVHRAFPNGPYVPSALWWTSLCSTAQQHCLNMASFTCLTAHWLPWKVHFIYRYWVWYVEWRELIGGNILKFCLFLSRIWIFQLNCI